MRKSLIKLQISQLTINVLVHCNGFRLNYNLHLQWSAHGQSFHEGAHLFQSISAASLASSIGQLLN